MRSIIHDLRTIVGEWLMDLTLAVLPKPEGGIFAAHIVQYLCQVERNIAALADPRTGKRDK